MPSYVRTQFTPAEREIVTALEAEGFARYAPRAHDATEVHAGFVVMEGMDEIAGDVMVNFATDEENQGDLPTLVTRAYARALEFHGYDVDYCEASSGNDEPYVVALTRPRIETAAPTPLGARYLPNLTAAAVLERGLTFAQAAEVLGTTPEEVVRGVAEGRIPAQQRPDGTWVLYREELESYQQPVDGFDPD